MRVAGASALAVIAAMGAASAAMFTVGVTEGNGQNRDFVAGSIDLGDAPGGSGGFDLNTILNGGLDFSSGDVVGIYGRIVSATDRFVFNFTATEGFNVSFDFDGYDVDADQDGTAESAVIAGKSGLINQADLGKSLTEIAAGAGGNKAVTFTLMKSGGGSTVRNFETNITSVTGDSRWIFGGDSGDYTLEIAGTSNVPALYDLEIAAVPLPFAGMLLGGALGGLALYRRTSRARPAAS